MVELNLDKIDFERLPVTREELEEWLDEYGDVVQDARELWLDLDVQVVSAVENPAHRSEAVALKSEEHERARAEQVPLLQSKEKEANEKRIMYAPAMVPNEKDKEGDVVPDFVVEKSAHDYLKNLRNREIDADHETPIQMEEAITSRGTVVESWLLKEEKEFETVNGSSQTYGEKTWMLGVQFEDDETWERVKSGEIEGWSIMGTPAVVKSTNLLQGENEDDTMTESDESNGSVSVEVEKEDLMSNIAEQVAEKVADEIPDYNEIELEPEVELKNAESVEELQEVAKEIDPDEVDFRNLDALIADLMPGGITVSDVTDALSGLRAEFTDTEEEVEETEVEEEEDGEDSDEDEGKDEDDYEDDEEKEAEVEEEVEETEVEEEVEETEVEEEEDGDAEKEVERTVSEKNQSEEETETGTSRFAQMWESQD